MARIALLGGSFDPIHFGHLAIAEEARVALGIDQVLFVPAAQQPLKAGRHYASANQRMEMTALAIADNAAFQICDVEVRRQGRSYTVETLETLRRSLGPDVTFFFILGADALRWLPQWRQPQRLLELAHIIAVERPGYTVDLEPLEQALPELPSRLIRLGGPHLDLSSTELRARVADGRPIRYLTPDSVVSYIESQGLYRGERH